MKPGSRVAIDSMWKNNPRLPSTSFDEFQVRKEKDGRFIEIITIYPWARGPWLTLRSGWLTLV